MKIFTTMHLILTTGILLLLAALNAAGSTNLTTLVYFNKTNGSWNTTGLDTDVNIVQANDGNFYGTTYGGGSTYANSIQVGYGTVFQMLPNGTFNTLVSFTTTNGGYPCGGLIQAADGNLYGTTKIGGAGTGGTVFKITTSGTLTILYSFSGVDGLNPEAGLVEGKDGYLYGTTYFGGASYVPLYYPPNPFLQPGALGTIFKMDTNGSLTTLISFNGTNGSGPESPLIQANDGNLYGTTLSGGLGYGTVFQMTPGGTLSNLFSFNVTNGSGPKTPLVQAGDGALYGTTQQGGRYGKGTVFKITTGGSFTTLISFDGTNGANPSAALIQAADGNFYGSASSSIIYQMTPGGILSTIFTFNGANGFAPGRLTQGSDGDFYGYTQNGGQSPTLGTGTIFRLSFPVQPVIQTTLLGGGHLDSHGILSQARSINCNTRLI